MTQAVDWDADEVEVLYDIEPINSGYHYRLFEVESEELFFARRWEVYDSGDDEHKPREHDEWEVTRDEKAIEEFIER